MENLKNLRQPAAVQCHLWPNDVTVMTRAGMHSSHSVYKARGHLVTFSLHQFCSTLKNWQQCDYPAKKGWVILCWRSHLKAVIPLADKSLWHPWIFPLGGYSKFCVLDVHSSENGTLLEKHNKMNTIFGVLELGWVMEISLK